MSRAKILIIDDEKSFANLLKTFLQTNQDKKDIYQIELAYQLDEALTKIDSFLPDLIITDLRLERELEGLEIFDYLKENNLDIPVIIITAYGNKQNILRCISKRPHYLFEKAGEFGYLKQKISQILTEVKDNSRTKPHLATVRSSLDKLPRNQHFQLVLERIESLNLEEYNELTEELPLLRLSIKDGEFEQKQLDKIDRDREARGLIPLSLIEKGNIYCEKQSHKSKITGKRTVYAYFYLRWLGDDGKQEFKYLGRYEKIKDPLILEKIHLKYPEFKKNKN